MVPNVCSCISRLPKKQQRIHKGAIGFLIFLIKPYEILEVKVSPMGQNFVVFTTGRPDSQNNRNIHGTQI
jgi:hypothetical protein